MSSTYTDNNKIEKPGTGEQSGTWGTTVNTDFNLYDLAIDGVATLALSGTTYTLNIPNGSAATPDGRCKILLCTGALAADCTVIVTPNSVNKYYFVQNNTTGGFNVLISQGSGAKVTVKPGTTKCVYLNGGGSGASVLNVFNGLGLSGTLETTGLLLDGATSGTTTVLPSAVASGTLTLPATTDTLVGKATTDTLTNKTLNFSSNTASNIPNAALVNSSITINGTPVSLGASITVNPSLSTLTIGTGLSGTSYNGSAPITIAIDSTVATLTGSQVLTNKTISGGSNTLSNIANASLTNSSMTLNGTLCTLGGTFSIGGGGGGGSTLTFGTGLTGGTYNGSAPITTAIDTSLVATLAGIQTLNNKTFDSSDNVSSSGLTFNGTTSGLSVLKGVTGVATSGAMSLQNGTDILVGKATTDTLTNKTMNFSSNTITNIPNSALTNSAITINGSSVSLGGSTTITAATLGALQQTNNLSDVNNAGTSRTNIGADNATNLTTGTIPVARLPIATTSVVGAVKIGSGLSVDGSGNVTANGVTYGIGSTVASGTSGSVLYVDASGFLAQQNSNFKWDAANHRLLLAGPGSVDATLSANAGTLSTSSAATVLMERYQTADPAADTRYLLTYELRNTGGGSTSATANYRIQRFISTTGGPYIEMADYGIGFGQSNAAGANVSVSSVGNLAVGTAQVSSRLLNVCSAANSSFSNPGLIVLTTGEVGMDCTPTLGSGIPLTVGTATCNATNWLNTSDVATKTSFEDVDFADALDKVANMPIRAWEYINQRGAKHIGPTSQDFHQAFGLGSDDKSISTLDSDGVLFACVKGLLDKIKRLEEKLGLS